MNHHAATATATAAAGNASGGAVVSADRCDALLRRALAARRHRPSDYPALRREYLNAARMRREALRREALRGAGTTARATNVQRALGRVYATVGHSRMILIRNNKVISAGTGADDLVIHTTSASAARHRAALARAQAKLTGWTRDLYRAVTVYTRALEKARERAARGLTDGVNRDDNTSYRRVRHAPASAVDAIHAGSIGMATPPDRMLR